MIRRLVGIGVVAGSLIASTAVRASSPVGPGSCPSDSKLLNGGPTQVFGDGPGTFWGLVDAGLEAAGFTTDAAKITYLNHIFGTNLGDLASLKAYNINQVDEFWDANGNGAVCVFDLRGARKHFDDPYLSYTYFGISDDRTGKTP